MNIKEFKKLVAQIPEEFDDWTVETYQSYNDSVGDVIRFEFYESYKFVYISDVTLKDENKAAL
jgi:hypothetical protein